jgi:hypothetical protein
MQEMRRPPFGRPVRLAEIASRTNCSDGDSVRVVGRWGKQRRGVCVLRPAMDCRPCFALSFFRQSLVESLFLLSFRLFPQNPLVLFSCSLFILFFSFRPGRVASVDVANSLLELSFEKQSITVDTTLLGSVAFRSGALFQFIGELAAQAVRIQSFAPSESLSFLLSFLLFFLAFSSLPPFPLTSSCLDQETGFLVLRPRVCSCVDGLDLSLYHQVMDIQRRHLAARARPASDAQPPMDCST